MLEFDDRYQTRRSGDVMNAIPKLKFKHMQSLLILNLSDIIVLISRYKLSLELAVLPSNALSSTSL